MIGLPSHSCLLVTCSKPKKPTQASDILNTTTVTWKHQDKILRIKQKDQPSVPFIRLNNYFDDVSICASVPESALLFVAFRSGAIAAYAFKDAVKVSSRFGASGES